LVIKIIELDNYLRLNGSRREKEVGMLLFSDDKESERGRGEEDDDGRTYHDIVMDEMTPRSVFSSISHAMYAFHAI
jgi:uncharacterized alpha-E superfamily protein